MNDSRTNEMISLRAFATAAGLPIGTCVDMSALAADPLYGEYAAREFTMCVAENVFKPAHIWRGPYEYCFDDADRLAEFARANHMSLRGHTLVWHESVPDWLLRGSYAPAAVGELLRAYILAVVGRYRGRICAWDVVNEAVTDGDQSDWRTDSFWYKALGPEYLDLAFRWAREADTEVPLYYNDYETEGMDCKSQRVYRLVKDLKTRGIPIDGVGLQGHLINGWRAGSDHRANIARLSALDLTWQFTEVDIRMILNGAPPTGRQLAQQASAYRDLIDLCLSNPGCRGMLMWGFTDRYSWIPGFRPGQGAALLLDSHYHPKPAYWAVADRLRQLRAASVSA